MQVSYNLFFFLLLHGLFCLLFRLGFFFLVFIIFFYTLGFAGNSNSLRRPAIKPKSLLISVAQPVRERKFFFFFCIQFFTRFPASTLHNPSLTKRIFLLIYYLTFFQLWPLRRQYRMGA